MKTLVFCTAYAEHRAVWDMRHAWWIKALEASDLRYDQLLLVDDASPELPRWSHLKVVREAEATTPGTLLTSAPTVLYTHAARLGRASVFDFPGWHRSFAFAARYAQAHGFAKVIHLESDAYVVSERMQRHINDARDGWSAPWSARYTFPEIAIQVAAGRGVAQMAAFAERPYTEMAGRLHEGAIPYTHVETAFVGDRYGEFRDDVPRGVDYVAQAHINRPRDYYWWIPETARRRPPPALPALGAEPPPPVELLPPFGVTELDIGWSGPEPGLRWMVGDASTFVLPPAAAPVEHVLELDVAPCGAAPNGQRLYVLVNERLVGEVILHRPLRLSLRIPAATLDVLDRNLVRILHPDGAPIFRDGILSDDRRLSIALLKCAFRQEGLPTPDNSVRAADQRPAFKLWRGRQA